MTQTMVTFSDELNTFVDITARLNGQEALALAQLIKRIAFTDIRQNAIDDAEAYVMLDALNQVRKSLQEAGYDPR